MRSTSKSVFFAGRSLLADWLEPLFLASCLTGTLSILHCWCVREAHGIFISDARSMSTRRLLSRKRKYLLNYSEAVHETILLR